MFPCQFQVVHAFGQAEQVKREHIPSCRYIPLQLFDDPAGIVYDPALHFIWLVNVNIKVCNIIYRVWKHIYLLFVIQFYRYYSRISHPSVIVILFQPVVYGRYAVRKHVSI